MRAFAYDNYGGPGSIHELPEPTPEAGQVRVRVRAASLNPFDNFVVQGYMKDRMPTELPLVPCGDFSGIVDMIGPGVDDFAVGDQVFGVTGRMIGTDVCGGRRRQTTGRGRGGGRFGWDRRLRGAAGRAPRCSSRRRDQQRSRGIRPQARGDGCH
ncbi:MAG: hypothetical protein E6I77_06890 [Chloroflexi bacterium]|nr:MAG: hypothetical protein E6I77_06890 [Chloroflexota bacterium]